MFTKLIIILLFNSKTFGTNNHQTSLCRGESLITRQTKQEVVFSERGFLKIKKLHANKFKLTGLKKGRVSAKGLEYDEIYILDCPSHFAFKKLKELTKSMLGINVTIHQSLIAIEGEILSFYDWKKIIDSKINLKNILLNLKVSPNAANRIKNLVETTAKQNDLPIPSISLHSSFLIYVEEINKNLYSIYQQVFQPLGFKVLLHGESIGRKPILDVKILAVEIKKHKLSELGIKWPTQLQWSFIDKKFKSDVFLDARAFEENGMGQVIASPNLLTTSGTEAQFHSGGEFPAKISNQFNNQVTWKKYGILLKIKPKVDNQDNISLNIDCEISNIDSKNTVDGVPALSMHRVTSQYILKDNQTIFLSGLTQYNHENNHGGLPGSSGHHIFKNLFGTEINSEEKTEIMFFVTPKIIKN